MKSGIARTYRMTVRAESAAATANRIIDVFVELFWERQSDRITLAEIADGAGVTVQTIVRRFGGKDGLFDAAVERETARVMTQRNRVTPGDLAGAVATLVEHYELTGDRTWRLFAEEQRSAAVKRVLDVGREEHLRWCDHVLGPYIAGARGVERRRRRAQLATVCDLATWHLLRRVLGLSRRQTELAILEMLEPLTDRRR